MEGFTLTAKLYSETIHHSDRVFGYYIYFWTENMVPFYVGMGTNRRAWNEHLPPVERKKLSCDNFKVVIVKDGLSKKMAHQQERELITSLIKSGTQLVNRKVPCLS